MHYLYSLITVAVQSLGQIFSLLVGWVIAVHFGRVPVKQKYILSAMGGISLIWAAMTLSLAFPFVRNILTNLTSGSVPVYVKLIIPLAGLGWIGLPLINGVLSMYLSQDKTSPLKILLGYKYTPGFAIALLLMLLSLPILLVPPLVRRLRREHMPVMIESECFESVLKTIEQVLREQDLLVELKPGTIWRRSPLAILGLFAHDLLGDWTKRRARMFTGDGLQIIVYPTDLVIEGLPDNVIKARNVIAKGLTFSEAFFTWDGEAHRLEEEINKIRRNRLNFSDRELLQRLNLLERDLDSMIVSFAEWESLYRQLLQVKVHYCSVLQMEDEDTFHHKPYSTYLPDTCKY